MRRRMMWWRGLAGASIAGLVVLAVPGWVAAQEVADRGAVERLATDFADKAGYPGIAVAITKDDRVLHVAGYGRDSSGAAVTATTPMPVASVSKSFTALAVMRLVEAGKMALDDPVRDHLPDFGLADPRAARITVRQLLNQTSGITDRTFAEKSLPQPGSLAAAVERAHGARLATEPGTTHAYTNTNYHLAARLVEVVGGESFADHLRRHVFEPLGMRASTTINVTPRDLPPEVRNGHVYAYGASVSAPEPNWFVNGSDGVITTAQDMAQWLIVQNSAGKAADGTPLVSAASMTAARRASWSLVPGRGDAAASGGTVIRVLLADDETMIRAGVRAILATDPDIDVVAEAGDGREAVELALAHRPDVVLLDIRTPRLDGLGAGAEIIRAAPTVASPSSPPSATTPTWPAHSTTALGASCSSPAARAS